MVPVVSDLPQRFTQNWREGHAAVGDELLAQAADLLREPLWASAGAGLVGAALAGPSARDRVLVADMLANLAQAHYAAANVRARPA